MAVESWKQTTSDVEERLYKQGIAGATLLTLAIGAGLTGMQFGVGNKAEKFKKAWKQGDKSALAWNTADVAANWLPFGAIQGLKWAPKAGKVGKVVQKNPVTNKFFGKLWSSNSAAPTTAGKKAVGRLAQAELVGEGISTPAFVANLAGFNNPVTRTLQRADPGIYAMEKAEAANRRLVGNKYFRGQGLNKLPLKRARTPFSTSENLYEKYVQKPVKRA